MRYLIFLICFPCWAAAPCNLFDSNFHIGPYVHTDEGNCLVWFCSVNHRWNTYAICGTSAETTGANIDHIASLTKSTQAQRNSAWDSLVATPVVAGSADDRLLKAALDTPVPKDIPIDGLVVQNQNAYRLTSPVNATPAFQLAGSVPLGTVCDTTQRMGPYYRVDRAKVTIPKGALLAPAYYANCDP